MFKYARLVPFPDCTGYYVIDMKTNRPVGEVLKLKSGGYEIFIRGQRIGFASISWQACSIADRYLAAAGSPQKKRKR